MLRYEHLYRFEVTQEKEKGSGKEARLRGEKGIVAARPDGDTFLPLGHIPPFQRRTSQAHSQSKLQHYKLEIRRFQFFFFHKLSE